MALVGLAATCTLAQAPEQAQSTTLPASQGAVALPGKAPRVSRELPDTYAGRVLEIGSGGGVTGLETTYALLDNGRLYRRTSSQRTYTYLGKQPKTATRELFSMVEGRCAIRQTTYQEPGNRYRFVGWRKGRAYHKVTWAPGDKHVPVGYEQVYKRFIARLPHS